MQKLFFGVGMYIHKNLTAISASVTCACLLMMTSMVSANDTKAIAPAPKPVAVHTPDASAVPSAQPSVVPSVAPTATASPVATPAPHRVLHIKPTASDPDLSGHIDYSFDPAAMRNAFKQIGVDKIPAHYHPFVQLASGGMEFLSLTQDGQTNRTSIYIMVVQDPDELASKLHALSRAHLSSMVDPMAVMKDHAYKCTQMTGYTVASIPVKKLSCSSSGTVQFTTEFAMIPDGQVPITVYAQTRGGSIDETGLKQVITEINTDKSMDS